MKRIILLLLLLISIHGFSQQDNRTPVGTITPYIPMPGYNLDSTRFLGTMWTGASWATRTFYGADIIRYDLKRADTGWLATQSWTQNNFPGIQRFLDSVAILRASIGTGGSSGGGNASTVLWGGVLNTPNTLFGYGIGDAYTKGQIDATFAAIFSPAFAGIPTAPTAAAGTSNNQLATTAFVQNAVAGSTAGVLSFNGRNGPVTPQSADYSGFYPILTGSYSNPAWISALSWGKITGANNLDSTNVPAVHSIGYFNTLYGSLSQQGANTSNISTLQGYFALGILKSSSFPSLGGDISNAGLSMTVGGIKGVSLPALSTGNLRYNGSAFVFDGTNYAPLASPVFSGTPKIGTDTVATLAAARSMVGTSGSGMSNPMTAQYDMIIGGTLGAPARLAAGANGQFLGVRSGVLNYYGLQASDVPNIAESQVSGLPGDLASKEATANKDATGGYAGLTLYKINFRNAANTFTSFFTNSNSAARTYTFKDADGTIAFTSDIPAAGANASGSYIVQTSTNAPSNAQALGSLSTGILKVTSTSGVLSTAVASDFPVLNQNTTGTAASITGSVTESQVTNLTTDLAAKQAQLSGTGYARQSGTTTSYVAAIPNSDLSQMAATTIKGNASGSTASAADLTATQVTAMLNTFGTTTKGLVPAPSSVNGYVLSDNGTWIAQVSGSLPTQTGNAGKFLVTDGTNASWGGIPAPGTVLYYMNGYGQFAPTNTDSIGIEGTNKWWTNARTLASTLTGYASTTGSITSSDNVLTAIEKLDGTKISTLSPALTGTPTAPTATAGTNTTQIATTAFVTGAVAASTTGVSQFNGRTGAVTPQSTDYSSFYPLLSAASTYTAGAKQTFGASATTAGLAFNSVTADPSTPANGDMWYRSDLGQFSGWASGAVVRFGAGGGGSYTSGSATTNSLFWNGSTYAPRNIAASDIPTLGPTTVADITSAGSGSLAGSLLNMTQTWNTTGNPTAIKLNVTKTAAGSTAKLIDLQIGGLTYFSVDPVNGSTVSNVQVGGSINFQGNGNLNFGSNFGGIIGSGYLGLTGGISISGQINMPTNTNLTGSSSTAGDLFAGASTVNYRQAFNAFGGADAPAIGVGNSYASLLFSQNGLTKAASGTHALIANGVFRPVHITAGSAAIANTATVYIDGASTTTVTGANYGLWTTALTRMDSKIFFDNTITALGTDGAQTINKPSGKVNFAAGATSLVVTNSLVTANSIVHCIIQTNDATATSVKSVVPAAGSFTINLNAATTGETTVGFIVYN